MVNRRFVVGSGQSNALGGEGGTGGDQTVNPRVKVWNGSAWVVATLGVAPFAIDVPVRNNAIWHFCKKLQEREDCDVYMVLSAKGNTPIADWQAPSGPEWIKLDGAVQGAAASPELADKPVDYFVWFQGEADGSNPNYRADFIAMRTAAIAAGWMTRDTPVLAGEILNKDALSYSAIKGMSDDFPWFRMVPNKGATKVGYPGSAHFTGDGYAYYGRSLFYPASLITPKLP
jgi:hypothetical protein